MKGKSILNNNKIYWAKVRPTAQIPTKRDEDAGYDLYADSTDDIVIMPHTTKPIPTGIACAIPTEYALILKERGSTGTKGIAQRSGVIDSGYRGEIQAPITNTNNQILVLVAPDHCHEAKTDTIQRIVANNQHNPEISNLESDYIRYPLTKAITQAMLVHSPNLDNEEIPYEDLQNISSERGVTGFGASGK